MVRNDFPTKVKRIIGNLSDNNCMICRKPLVTPNYAHIIPASPEGPRSEYRNQYDEKFIKSVENGLCLCNDCHNEIDTEVINTYSIDDLFAINKQFKYDFQIQQEYKSQLGIHEKDFFTELQNSYQKILDYLNQELDPIINYVEELSYDKIPYEEKMNLNNFDYRHMKDITFVYAEEFSAFQKMLEESPIVGIKMKAAISALYIRISANESDNNKLIDKMLDVMYDPSERALGNKISLYYYFIICEVFSTK